MDLILHLVKNDMPRGSLSLIGFFAEDTEELVHVV